MAMPRRSAAMMWLAAAVVAAAVAGVAASETSEEQKLGCFCDCMKNRCMTLGGAADKYDCAAACTQACTQLGKPGQPRDDDFCGF